MRTREKGHQLLVRLPEALRVAIKRSAEVNLRSMNSEIVYHLQNAVQQRGGICVSSGREAHDA
ncbi:Arc family DNA-binding protein [Agrobacterium sp. ES01]|uniref:Arc family DNA-binding protein n=1 Tax=Agrobacterium sp. ES01 TaxID=3420714 RepID=UPI003D0F1A55